MSKQLGSRIHRNIMAPFAAGAALLLAALANFLTHNAYPLIRPEVGVLATGILLLSAAMALFYSAQRQWGRSFLEGLLTVLFVDLNGGSVPLIVTAWIGVVVLTLWGRISLLGPMAVLGGVILATTVAGLGGRESWISSKPANANAQTSTPDRTRPALVHLIFDEHIGIEGLPDNPGGQALKGELKSFYATEGFALYGGAYSEHLHTVNAIPYILNYGRRLAQTTSTDGAEIGRTEHLQGLARRGYRTIIFQSDFADFCTGSTVHECTTYDRSSLQPTLHMPLETGERAALAASKFASLSKIFERLAKVWNLVAVRSSRVGIPLGFVAIEDAGQSSTVGAIAAVGVLEQRLRHAKPGEAYFAHFLVPHYPYVVDEGCRPLPWQSWERRRSSAPQEVRQNAYYGQLRCTTDRLRRLLRALDQSPAGKNVIVILHGDHGSRITQVDPNEPNRGKFSDADVIAGFSTLFAVRGPGITASYNEALQPASSLLEEFAAAEFKAAPLANKPLRPLRLDDWRWRPRGTLPLPASWRKRLDRPVAGQ